MSNQWFENAIANVVYEFVTEELKQEIAIVSDAIITVENNKIVVSFIYDGNRFDFLTQDNGVERVSTKLKAELRRVFELNGEVEIEMSWP